MGWSVKLGRIAGITIHMHLTFLLLIFWIGLSHWLREGTWPAVVTGTGFVLALFGCVLLHELGHALAARRYGIGTRDITLLPIGGVARLERMPDEPREELWVALAGPAVNVVIAAVLGVWLFVAGGWQPISQLDVGGGSFIERLMLVNLFLVGFNLLPAFPMDGGRVLRALLAMRMDYAKATQRAAGIGQMMAFLFGFLGLFGNPFLLFIAFFVWIGAAQEASMVQTKSTLADVIVESAMQTNFQVLSSADTLERAVELILSGAQQDFPVVWGSEVIGVLTRSQLLVALAQHGQEVRVADVMSREFCQVKANDLLEPQLVKLGQGECRTMPVLRDGQLVGLLTMDNVGEYVMIQSALHSKKAENTSPQSGV
jgi:Zn-dependent protease/predicted transcriptional regulator